MTTVKFFPSVSVPLLVPPTDPDSCTLFTLCCCTSVMNCE